MILAALYLQAALGACNEHRPSAKANMCSELYGNIESHTEMMWPGVVARNKPWQEIMYNDDSTNNTNSYSGYEVLNVSQNSPISGAQFSITQYASAVTISGLEMIQNSGKEAIIDLLDGRMNVAEAQLVNRIGGDIYLDGTGNSGKNITGLAAAVPDSPSTGTYGGINRASFSFWRSVAYSNRCALPIKGRATKVL